MITLALYTLIFLLLICYGGSYFWRSYETPRDVLAIATAYVGLLCWSVYGASDLYIDRNIITIVGCMLGWWIVCALKGKRLDISMIPVLVFISNVIIAMLLSNNYLTFGITLIVSAVLVNCFYAIMQSVFRYEPNKSNINTIHHYAIGFIGNENMLGNLLVPSLFLNIWLVRNVSTIWGIGIPIMLLTLYKTRCRTAFIGFAVGIYYYMIKDVGFLFSTFNIIFFGAISYLVFWLPRVGRIKFGERTFQERLNYLRVGWEHFKIFPIFGAGFCCSRVHVPFIQRDINRRTKGEFLKRENYLDPWPRSLHNDYLQHVLDNGIVGLLFILTLLIYALFTGLGNELKAALIGLVICGLGFHTFHVRSINLIFWFLVFTLLRTPTPITFNINPIFAVITLILIGVLIYGYLSDHVIFDYTFNRFMKAGGSLKPSSIKCYNYPNTLYNTHVGVYFSRKGDLGNSVKHFMSALGQYDGEQRIWELWYNLGLTFFLSGSVLNAQMCYEEALSFWPAYENARHGLDQIRNMMSGGKKGYVVQLG